MPRHLHPPVAPIFPTSAPACMLTPGTISNDLQLFFPFIVRSTFPPSEAFPPLFLQNACSRLFGFDLFFLPFPTKLFSPPASLLFLFPGQYLCASQNSLNSPFRSRLPFVSDFLFVRRIYLVTRLKCFQFLFTPARPGPLVPSRRSSELSLPLDFFLSRCFFALGLQFFSGTFSIIVSSSPGSPDPFQAFRPPLPQRVLSPPGSTRPPSPFCSPSHDLPSPNVA